MDQQQQSEFDLTIGTLDRVLSKLIISSEELGGNLKWNVQTLKHHAEDMIGAGNKILENLKKEGVI